MATLFNSPLRIAAAQLLRVLMPMVVHAAPAGPGLVVDGRVRVVGGGIENASMVVERDGSIIAIHTTGLDRFELPLELQRIYLLTFQHPGCIEKQLLFDTHVPDALQPLAPFSFPFKVTLEPRTDKSDLHYAGPVGFVRFHAAARDFNYDRDYTMVRDGLDPVRTEEPASDAGAERASSTVAAPPGAMEVNATRAPVEREEVLARENVLWRFSISVIGSPSPPTSHL